MLRDRVRNEGIKMKSADIKLLYQYNEWANNRILDAAEKLSPEQLTQANDFGWGSLRGALVHILDAEYGWRLYLSNRGEGWIKEGDFSDLPAIRERWQAENRALWEYLNSLSDEDLDGRVGYEVKGGARHHILWHCLVHVVNHGTQHRSECAALLTSFGASPGDMDFTVFLSQRSAATG